MSARLERRARRTASAPGVPPEAREDLREEILAHLEDSAASYRDLGLRPREAERIALRDFGDHRKTREDIGRAWRGKRTVLFPDQPGQRLAHFRAYDLKAVLVIVAIVVLLRWQVVAAYHIPTKSMEPTLHGDPANGDKILVNKLFFHLNDAERWQLAVFEKPGDDRNLIKRILGLPGETLDIRDGDIWIDGEIARKPRDVQEDLLIPVFSENRDLLHGGKDADRGLAAWQVTGDWKEAGGGFRAAAPGEESALLGWTRTVPDSYPGGDRSFRSISVGDLVLEFVVTPDEGTVSAGAVLREGDNVFGLLLPVGEGDAVLRHFHEELGRAKGVHLRPGEPTRIRLANLDDRVTVEIDGREVISAEVAGVPAKAKEASNAPVAEFGIQGGAATFASVTLRRDIHYHHEGRLPTEIPADSYYMLGDNSGNSADSREWGPIPRDLLIGRPVMVFWPLSRAKMLH